MATVKAVLYARVSSKDQERDGFSIPAQKKLLDPPPKIGRSERVGFCDINPSRFRRIRPNGKESLYQGI